jgi:hypothetical protein
VATNNDINSPIPIPVPLGGTGVSSFSAGILKSTTPTGALGTATAGTDYYSPGYPTFITDTASTSFYNLALGRSNFTALTSGGLNLAMGYTALAFLSSGSYNIGIGFEAGSSITTANCNTFIGYQAGYLNQGSGNTILGCNAGSHSGTNCLSLGYLADSSTSGLTNATAIGYNSKVGISNAIVLGSTSTTVGIGTSSPTQANLVVNGGIANVSGEDSCIRAMGSKNSTKIELVNTSALGRNYELRSNSDSSFSIYDRTSATPRASIDPSGNFYIPNSVNIYGRRTSALMTMQGNVTGTTITIGGTYVKIAGAYVLQNLTSDLTTTGPLAANGRIIYGGSYTIYANVKIDLNAFHNGGGGDEIRFAIYKNSVIISYSVVSGQGSNNSILSYSLNTIVSLVANDYLEIWCTHPVNGKIITVKNLIWNISAT